MLDVIMKMDLFLYCMGVLGAAGITGMFAIHLSYRRKMRNTEKMKNLKEKWITLWKTRDRLLRKMNDFVWYPSILSTTLLAISIGYTLRLRGEEGLSLLYLYVGTTVPIVLLLLRHILDFAYKEELVMASLSDYLDQMKEWIDMAQIKPQKDSAMRDEIVEKITSSIRETAAAGSYFRKMLTPEEEDIMKEIIQEFMNE